MQGALNPFHSGIRPATGPTVARPGQRQFLGTGGAFAPEQTLQMTSGLRGLKAPLDFLGGTINALTKNPQIVKNQPQFQGLLDKFGGTLANTPEVRNAMQSFPPDIAHTMMVQQQVQAMERMFSQLTNIMKATHDVAMNSVRNLKA
jgi:hypothetical protein